MPIDNFRTVKQIAAELGLSYAAACSRARRGKFGRPEKVGSAALYHISSIPDLG